jgi:hypothetical protein
VGRGAPDLEVARLAGLLTRRFDELVDRLTARIAAEVDLYRYDAVVPRVELRRSVRDNFEFMLGQMSTSDAPDLSAPRSTGRLRAQRGAPLPEVLRAYRLGSRSSGRSCWVTVAGQRCTVSSLCRCSTAASAGSARAASAMRSSESCRISAAAASRSSSPRSTARSSGSGSARAAM